MSDLVAKAREFGKKYPTPKASPSPSQDTTWDQNCGIAMFQFGSFLGWITAPRGDISSARRAASNSTIESRDYRTAPLGAWHWFDIGGWGNGHVMQQVDRGTLIFGGTSAVWETVGVALGFMDVPTYLKKRPGATYLGWSRDYSGGTVRIPADSAPAANPAPIVSVFKEKNMKLFWDTLGTGYLSTEDGISGLGSPQIYNLFARVINSDQKKNPFWNADRPETFLRAEIDIMNNHLKLHRTANQIGTQIDGVKLASAISDELKKKGIPVTIENLQDAEFEVDAEVLAAAFEAAVPRVSAAIVKQAGLLLSK